MKCSCFNPTLRICTVTRQNCALDRRWTWGGPSSVLPDDSLFEFESAPPQGGYTRFHHGSIPSAIHIARLKPHGSLGIWNTHPIATPTPDCQYGARIPSGVRQHLLSAYSSRNLHYSTQCDPILEREQICGWRRSYNNFNHWVISLSISLHIVRARISKSVASKPNAGSLSQIR